MGTFGRYTGRGLGAVDHPLPPGYRVREKKPGKRAAAPRFVAEYRLGGRWTRAAMSREELPAWIQAEDNYTGSYASESAARAVAVLHHESQKPWEPSPREAWELRELYARREPGEPFKWYNPSHTTFCPPEGEWRTFYLPQVRERFVAAPPALHEDIAWQWAKMACTSNGAGERLLAALPDPAFSAAVIVARHRATDYDARLREGEDRMDARSAIDAPRIVRGWQAGWRTPEAPAYPGLGGLKRRR